MDSNFVVKQQQVNMGASVIRDYLVLKGAREDEIRVLTHSIIGPYREVLEVLVTGTIPGGAQPSDELVGKSITRLLRLFRDHPVGVSLALERIMPRILSMFPGSIPCPMNPNYESQQLTHKILHYIQPDRLEHMSRAMNVHGWFVLFLCLKHQEVVGSEFTLRELSSTVESISDTSRDIHHRKLSIEATLEARNSKIYSRMDYLRAVFRGAEKCKNPERLLNDLAQEIKSSDGLSDFLSCPFVYGVDPFVLSEEPSEYIARTRHHISKEIQVSPPLVDVVMEYFCKFRETNNIRGETC